MRAQSLNTCEGVGVEVTSHSYWKHGAEVQSTLGRVCSQLYWENRGNSYRGEHTLFHIDFGMNTRKEKNSIRARPRRLGKFWSMLERFWSILELKIEESCCQA
jgi:hypothetical protein